MRIHRFLFFFAFLAPVFGQSQVNSSIKSSSRSYTTYHSSTSSATEAAGVLIQGVQMFVYWGVFLVRDVVVPYQIQLLSRKETISRITSIELHPGFGIGLNTGGLVYLPRARASWGLFSTDFRYFSHIETGPGFRDDYTTLDWQVLSLNLVQTKQAHFYMGSGFMFERNSGNYYHENTAGLEFFLKESKHRLGTEWRWAVDYEGARTARLEGSVRGATRILDAPHFTAWASATLLYQRYYQGVDLFTATAGIAFQLH